MLTLYAQDIAPGHSDPIDTLRRLRPIGEFFKGRRLSEINGALCRQYVRQRGSQAAAWRDLALLRAAINHHRAEGHTDRVISVTLPPPPKARDTWLTRDEAARLLWAAWRYREVQKGVETTRHSRRHVARFILVALYTGTRSGAVFGAALDRVAGAGFVDLDRGVFYRRPHGRRETKKRQPPVPLPARLLAHLRRWKRLGAAYVVEWNGLPVASVRKAFRNIVADAGLPPNVTPHTLRHTAATWLMQRGAPEWEAAGYLGMTVETLRRVYGHHHPAHMAGARDLISKRS